MFAFIVNAHAIGHTSSVEHMLLLTDLYFRFRFLFNLLLSFSGVLLGVPRPVAMRDADAHFALLAENIIRATNRRDISQLLSIARTLRSKLVPSVYTLTATRIGRAVAARKLHVIQTRNVGALFAALTTIWKEAHRARKLRAGRVIHQEPDAVKLIAAFIRGVDAVAAPMDACRRVARVFAERGYETWRDIPGTNPVPLRAAAH